jgi:hypothetical protein
MHHQPLYSHINPSPKSRTSLSLCVSLNILHKESAGSYMSNSGWYDQRHFSLLNISSTEQFEGRIEIYGIMEIFFSWSLLCWSDQEVGRNIVWRYLLTFLMRISSRNSQKYMAALMRFLFIWNFFREFDWRFHKNIWNHLDFVCSTFLLWSNSRVGQKYMASWRFFLFEVFSAD